MVKSSEVIFVDGLPVAFKREGQFMPVLTNTVALEKMPRVTVDMGAVPHVVGGADIMAPGIRKVEGTFGENGLVVIIDFFFSSRRRHTRFDCDWSSDVCSSD